MGIIATHCMMQLVSCARELCRRWVVCRFKNKVLYSELSFDLQCVNKKKRSCIQGKYPSMHVCLFYGLQFCSFSFS